MDKILYWLSDFNELSITVRLLAALLLGGLIGMERGRHGRAAGMRTHVLVCVGACMTALVGLFMSDVSDATRIAAQVISGIGFLGAGTIMIRNQSVVTGLTTAAGVWCTATIGIALGYGFYLAAVIATVITIVTATLLTRLEGGKKYIVRCHMELKNAENATATVAAIEQMYPTAKVTEVLASKSNLPGSIGLSLSLSLDEEDQKSYLAKLNELDNVLFVLAEE
ncbi:MAG: MgtC/SapB family protein [Clostridia bacterium]|nr:MgtC/SapB family protein [Clostridia bacterium]